MARKYFGIVVLLTMAILAGNVSPRVMKWLEPSAGRSLPTRPRGEALSTSGMG